MAQEQKAEPSPFRLEPVTVTAQKVEEHVQDVPMSLSVFSGTDIEDSGSKDMSDLVRYVPNLFMNESSAENLLVLRGVSSFTTSIYSPTGFYVDGVNFPLHYMYNTELLDLERAEVLRGPQGTLYGRNSESGVINLVTRQPDNEFKGKLFTEYSSYDSWRAGMNASGPIIENTLYLGVAAQASISDGFITNTCNGDDKSAEKDQKNGRATLRWTPTDQWDLSFTADFMDTDDQQNSYRYRTGPYTTDYNTISHNDADEYSRQEGNGQTLNMKYSGESFNMTSVTGLRTYSHSYSTDMDCTNDLGPLNWGASPNKYSIDHMSQEVRLFSPDNQGPFQWLAGIYGFKEETEVTSERKAWAMKADTDIDIDGYAGFGQCTVTVLDKMHLTAGLRFDHQQLHGTMTGKGGAGVIDQDKKLDYNEWLPKFSIAYDLTGNIMAYTTASKGYMVGGYNYGYMPSDKEAFYYDPEYTWNYEAGIKTSWLNERLIANLAAFYIDIDDKQVVEWSFAAGTSINNAAKAHCMGVELEVQARPLPGLDLFSGFGYVKSEFDDWKALQQDGSYYDFDGNSLPNVPQYTYNLGASYFLENGLFTRAELLGTGEFYGDPKNNTKQEAYEIVNLRFGYEAESWKVEVWSKNLLDEEYVTALFDNSAMGLGELVQDGDPRTIGITTSYYF